MARRSTVIEALHAAAPGASGVRLARRLDAPRTRPPLCPLAELAHAARADGRLGRAQRALYDALCRCLLDTLRGLDLTCYALGPAAAAPGQAAAASAAEEGGGAGGEGREADGGEWEGPEGAALAAELGGGLVAGNPADMARFLVLSGGRVRLEGAAGRGREGSCGAGRGRAGPACKQSWVSLSRAAWNHRHVALAARRCRPHPGQLA